MENDVILKTLTDKNEICDILERLSTSFYNQEFNNAEQIKILSEKFSQYAVFRCAYKGNIPCGFTAFYDNDKKEYKAFLSMIIVDRLYQHNGIGRILLADVIDICRKEKMRYLDLEVDNGNSKAIQFYKNFGFKFYDKKSDNSSIYEYDMDFQGEKNR